MTIRLTLALLALPLIPFQGSPNPYECPAEEPVFGECENSPIHAGNFCNFSVQEAGGSPMPGSCLKPFHDCYWQVTILGTNCSSDIANAVFTSTLPGGGEQTINGHFVGNTLALGPIGISVDCAHTDPSPLITFFNASGTILGHCHLSFSCGQCPIRISGVKPPSSGSGN